MKVPNEQDFYLHYEMQLPKAAAKAKAAGPQAICGIQRSTLVLRLQMLLF